MKTNLAFKLNYCNGGMDKLHYGFRDVCSAGVIGYNIKKQGMRTGKWCAQPECPCCQFYEGKITYQELARRCREEDGVCMESRLFQQWVAQAEYDFKDSKPRSIRGTCPGSLAVLTTVKPNMDEANRKIFAVFLIDRVYEGDETECGYVTAHPRYRLELSPKDTNDLNFWNFYQNENSPKKVWAQGVFRYLYDSQAEAILRKIAEIRSREGDGTLAEEMLDQFRRTRVKWKNLPETPPV